MNALSRKFTFLSLIKFTIPTIIMMVFMSLYTMVDGIFVSNLVGAEALSAINIVYPAMSIVVAVSIMLATGSSAIIAKEMGEGNATKARSNFSFIILVGIILGILFAVFGILFIDELIVLMGATPEIVGYCYDYLYTIILASPLAVLQMMFQFLFVTAGKPNLGLATTVIGGIMNIVLDYILIGPLDMGIKGASIATSIGYSIPAIVGLIYFAFARKEVLHFVLPKFDGKMLLKSCLNGSSEMVTNLAMAVTTFLFNMVMLEYLGVDGVAAITIVLYSQFLLISAFIGFSSGVAPVFSYNHGAKKYAELKKIYRYSITFIGTCSILALLFSVLLAKPITAVFIDSSSPVYEITKNGFLLFSISYLFSGINIFASAMFTSFSNGMLSAIISFLRTFLLLSVSILVLPMLIGEIGIWLAVPLAEFCTLALSIFLILKYKKRYQY